MRRLFPVLASGVLLGMAYPPSAVPGLGFAALAPLFIRWTQTPHATQAYGEAVLAHVIAYGIAFRWAAFHPIPSAALASVGGILALALLTALPYGLAHATASLIQTLGQSSRSRSSATPNASTSNRPPEHAGLWARRKQVLAALMLAALIVATEAILARGPWALPWTTLSHTVAWLPQARWAARIGGPGLSVLVVATNALLTAAWLSVRSPPRHSQPHRPHVGRPRTILVLFGITLGGMLAVPSFTNVTGGASTDSTTKPTPSFAITAVQPARPPLTWSDTSNTQRVDEAIRQTYLALTPSDAAHSDAAHFDAAHHRRDRLSTDLVVWPETTLPPLRNEARTRMHRRIQAMVDSLGIPLLTGAVSPARALDDRPRYRNRVQLFLPGRSSSDHAEPEGAPSLTYDKHHLVPFAEHVPFVDDWPALQRFSVPAGGVAGYLRGNGPALFSIPTRHSNRPVRIAPLICFETVVGPYVQEAAQGADVLVAVSQVGWWGRSDVLPQYQALTRLRALETGRPIVVATVTGPSFVAQPDGTVTVLTDWMSDTATSIAIPIPQHLE